MNADVAAADDDVALPGQQYRRRGCPACNAPPCVGNVMQSSPRAENASFGDLLEAWDTDIFTHKGFFSYGRCGTCGLLYCPVYPDASQLAQLYGSMKPNMSELPEQSLRRTQAGYLRTALRYRPPPGDVIEIGPDRGFLAADAAQRDEFSHFWFIEPNVVVHDELLAAVTPKACQITEDLNRFDHIPDGCASLALMVHVLDHLTDPMHHLAELYRCLKPGGIVSIVVHNERSLLARAFGSRHPIYCPYHPQLFNPQTLAAMLTRAGLKVLELSRTVNHYPLGYLLKNAAFRAGFNASRIPMLPRLAMPLPLGNLQITARKRNSVNTASVVAAFWRRSQVYELAGFAPATESDTSP